MWCNKYMFDKKDIGGLITIAVFIGIMVAILFNGERLDNKREVRYDKCMDEYRAGALSPDMINAVSGCMN